MIACQSALCVASAQTTAPIKQAALRVVQQAIEAPARAILENAGREAAPIIDDIRRAGSPIGFDVVRGELVDMVDAGIVDSLQMLKTVVRTAIHSAALALTIDVIVHTGKQEISVNPEG